MIALCLEISLILLCVALLFFLSLLDAAISQSNILTLRMTQERSDARTPSLLPLVLTDISELLVPFHLGIQIAIVTAAILTTHLSLMEWSQWGLGPSFAIVFCISLVFRQLLPRLMTQNEPEKKLVRLLVMARPLHAFLRALALPLLGVLNLFKRMFQESDDKVAEASPETTEEEIQAYLDIGEDHGIIEEEDSELIQSVVEFGDTLVREVMTPRTKIVACNENATIGELRDIMVLHRHSRIPIFRDDTDHIIGIAYIRQLLAHNITGKESEPITGLVQPALFVPESKRVSTLLKELQERGGRAAMVIDEFGGVAGMVTIEDLVEEIVGEIRDEDQAQVSEVFEDGPGNYIVRGSTELHRIEELTGKRLDRTNSSTVAGLITAFLGRVPAPGEEFDIDGLRIQVLDADRRRIRKIRLQLVQVNR